MEPCWENVRDCKCLSEIGAYNCTCLVFLLRLIPDLLLSVLYELFYGNRSHGKSVCFSVLGHNSEDCGQSQSEKRGLLWVTAQSPAVWGGSLATLGHGGIQCEREVWTSPPFRGMEVRLQICSASKRSHWSLFPCNKTVFASLRKILLWWNRGKKANHQTYHKGVSGGVFRLRGFCCWKELPANWREQVSVTWGLEEA